MPIAILGPTASGKSALALEVARRLGGTVVNGDPFQALEGIPIGTGQPTPQDQHQVPHLGYGVLGLATRPNPAAFGLQVRQWLSSCASPVLVTGSGLYLRGIWDQLTDLPEVPEVLVARVRAWFATLGSPRLHRYLAAVDPARAAELHPNDGSRVQRALCLHLATGQRPSALLTGIDRGVPEGWVALLVLPARDALRERVARRVRAMVAAGWAEEARRVVAEGHEADLRALRPLGYDTLLDGGRPAAITTATQAYAKRQATFFQRQWPDLPTWDPDREDLDLALDRLGIR
jgi:tRNA dimethylallyltransferase